MRKLLILGVLVLLAVLAAAAPAAAGGWAVATLDPLSVPAAGEPMPVGFTIRRHGVRPADAHASGPVTGTHAAVGITVRPSGDEEMPSGTFFPAEQVGPTGHYVAEVVFPEAGRFTWAVHKGWFGTQELGTIGVGVANAAATADAAAPEAPTSGSEYRWPLAARLLLPVVVAGCVSLVAFDAWGRRGTPKVVAG